MQIRLCSGLWTSSKGGESWYYFEGGGMSLSIPLLWMQESYPFICSLGKCAYVCIIVNIVSSWIYKAP